VIAAVAGAITYFFMLKNFDVLISSSTQYNTIGQPIGYSVSVINLGPIDATIAVIVAITILTIFLFPKKHANK